MRSVVVYMAGSSALVALLFTASCLEPDRNNGEPCLSDDQCESNYCRAGVCVTRPDTNETSSLPPATDAAPDVVEDAAAEDAEADVVEDAAAEDAEADVVEDAAAEDAEADAAEDAAPDVVEDAAAEDAAPDVVEDAASEDAGADAAEDAQTD